MTVHTGIRFGVSYGFAAGDSGWGASFNLQARLLETMLPLVLLSDSTVTPPISPTAGDAYFIPTGATGAWVGHVGQVAAWQDSGWNFYNCPTYTRAQIVDRSGFFYYSGTVWQPEVTSTGGVTSVAGRTGDVALSVGDVSGAAPLSSPPLTGNPTAPDQTALTRNTRIANTKYVDDAVAAIGAARVTSVAGRAGDVTLSHSDITDWSTATAAFLTSSALSGYASISYVDGQIAAVYTAIAGLGGGTGTVTSVAMTVPSAIYDVSGSPVTGSGTLALTLKTQAAKTVFAGPASGADAAPTFRALAPADLVVASGGGSDNYLRADGTWATPPGSGGGSSAQIDTYTAGGTWTKPAGAKSITVILYGGGGGGAGGQGGATSSIRRGGTGGGGGARVERVFLASDLSATETITVGTGGGGGAGGTSANGAVGSVGGTTSFGSRVSAYGGGGGYRGDASNATNNSGGAGGGVGSAGASGSAATSGGGFPGGTISVAGPGVGGGGANGSITVANLHSEYGGAAGGGVDSTAAGSNAGTSVFGGGGGGGAGGLSAANGLQTVGSGGQSGGYIVAGGSGGTAGTSAGAGGGGAAGDSTKGGAGGGGGAPNASGTGGAGGAGGANGGGGGGGAGGTTTGGAGGNGGGGAAYVITYF